MAKQDTDIAKMLEESRNVLYGDQNDMGQVNDADAQGSETMSHRQPGIGESVNSAQSRDTDNNGMPQWAVGMCKQLNSIEQNLSSQINTQNKRWSKIENQLENQNLRMSNIEAQISQISSLQEKVSENDRNLTFLKTDYLGTKEQVREHDKSLQYQSQVCDDLIEKKHRT